jgi:N6-adenosine-specific RNA methylase IME4
MFFPLGAASPQTEVGEAAESGLEEREIMGNDLVKVPDLLTSEDMPREEFVATAKRIRFMEKFAQWALGALWIEGAPRYGDSQRLADDIGIDLKTVQNYARVVRAIPESSRRWEILSFNHHEAVAALPAPQRDEWLDRAERDELPVMELRRKIKHAAVKDRRANRVQELAEATKAASLALGKKLYGVLYADPPWKFVPYVMECSIAENHYPTMPLDQIKALKVPAAPDCVLFLWATVPMLPQALEVMAAWGFEYKSSLYWRKDRTGTGYWTLNEVEQLLIGTKGNVPAPAPGDQPRQWIEAPRGPHSWKPDMFADEIAALYPDVPKLEMFARELRDGWDYHGNEGGYGVEVTPLEAALEAQSGAPVSGDAKALLMGQLEKQHKRYRMNRAFRYRARQAAKGAPQ